MCPTNPIENRRGTWARLASTLGFPSAVFVLHVVMSWGFQAYDHVPWLDMPMHVIGGIAITYAAARALEWAVDVGAVSAPDARLRDVLLLTTAATFAVLWELFEWLADRTLGTTAQAGLDDTLCDMLLGIVGSVTYLVATGRRRSGALVACLALTSLVGACRFGYQVGPADPTQDGWPPGSGLYSVSRAPGTMQIDGRVDAGEWAAAPWTADFGDIEGETRPAPRHRTRAKMMWDDDFFYVAAELEDPDVWASLTERDSVIYDDNDFEVFIDPDGDTHDYYELEVNALGTVWDLMLRKPYRDGGPAIDGWDIAGLEVGVHVDGTVNQAGDVDRGWMVEIAIPWSALEEATDVPCPPRPGDRWRVNFSRVQWQHVVRDGGYAKLVDAQTGEAVAEDNWTWAPQYEINMHAPERWGFVQFSADGDVQGDVVELDQAEYAKWALRGVYRAQRAFHETHGRFSDDVDALALGPAPDDGYSWPPEIAVTPSGYEAWVVTDDGRHVAIDEGGRTR